MGHSIFHVFHLECARRLPRLPAEHPCARLHGHSFRIEVHVSGPLNAGLGWVVDFAELDAAWRPIAAQLDHRTLNDVPGLDNPTSENLAAWLWVRLQPSLPGLDKIIVQETVHAGCVYTGP